MIRVASLPSICLKGSLFWGHQHVSPKLPVTPKPNSPNWLPGFLPAPVSPVQIIHFVEPIDD